ncbi:hypothetical protein MTR_5g066790 [Medicago truncatula]|uniref:Uncharacterized protein n=1 Tax=Medicago truncatula TaxID=3880 RepID=G7JYI1_MEDTR|nr:hypothetical protein MTR_5g066790 [Medicago truncatula]
MAYSFPLQHGLCNTPNQDKHQGYNNFSRFVYAAVMGIHAKELRRNYNLQFAK